MSRSPQITGFAETELPTLVFVSQRTSGPSRRMESLVAWVRVTQKKRLQVVTVDADRNPDVAGRVQHRLAAEPTVFAPRAIEPPRRRATRYALSMAASVAAVALVGWMALPLFDFQREAPPQATVQLPEPPLVAVPVAQGVSDYLLAHQRFSPSLAIGGIAPYIRSVSEENGAR